MSEDQWIVARLYAVACVGLMTSARSALIFEDVTGQVSKGRDGMQPPHLTHLPSSLDHPVDILESILSS